MGAGAKHIPAEVVHEILSSFGSADLVSACLVSRIFQAEAERLLYRSVGYRVRREKFLSFLDTTAAVKSKASLVKSLFIYIRRVDDPSSNSTIIERLSVSLPNMTALANLRLCTSFDVAISEDQRISLIQVLQRSTFSLTSFCTSLDLDLRSFIPNQTSLQYLVFDHPSWNYEPSELSLYQELIQSSPPENQLYLFTSAHYGTQTDTITSFPAFSRDWSAAPIKRALPGIFVSWWKIYYFVLYIDTLSDHEHFRQYVKSISDNFPGRISDLDVHVRDHRIDKNPEELASTLSCLTMLSEFRILYWETDDREVRHSYLDDRVDLARRWSAQCPTLSQIIFPDWSACTSNGEGTGWSLVRSLMGDLFSWY